MMLRDLVTVTLGSMFVAAFVVFGAGCGVDCPDYPVESGDYEMNAHGDHEWLDGATLTIDREAGTAKIRYIRDGSTYEVTFTLDQ